MLTDPKAQAMTPELLEEATWEERFTFAWDALLKMEHRAEDAERLLAQERACAIALDGTDGSAGRRLK